MLGCALRYDLTSQFSIRGHTKQSQAWLPGGVHTMLSLELAEYWDVPTSSNGGCPESLQGDMQYPVEHRACKAS